MSLAANNTALSSDITNFKNRVKAEMIRRKNSNSPYSETGVPASYQGNFTDSASAGQQIKTSHYRETAGYLASLFSDTAITWATSVSSGTKLNSIQAAYNFLTSTLEKDKARTSGTSHHCKSACRGLCNTACVKDCEGWCTSAHGNCSNSCGGSYPCGK